MTIHYHGGPINPRTEQIKLAGKHFCVSFTDTRYADWCVAHAQSVMWDNGAYSIFNSGGSPLDEAAFYAFVEKRLAHPHWAVVPDVIDGDVEAQRRLVATWPFRREFGAPVWHLAHPFDRLLELADEWPKVCFGSSGRYWQVGSDDWARRVDGAFNWLMRHRGSIPWIHMLRGMALTGDRWPFASVDSVNVARNFKDDRVCPERMARRLDTIQCPIAWEPVAEQVSMFAD